MATCEQCFGVSETLYLSPRGSICQHCLRDPDRGPKGEEYEYYRDKFLSEG